MWFVRFCWPMFFPLVVSASSHLGYSMVWTWLNDINNLNRWIWVDGSMDMLKIDANICWDPQMFGMPFLACLSLLWGVSHLDFYPNHRNDGPLTGIYMQNIKGKHRIGLSEHMVPQHEVVDCDVPIRWPQLGGTFPMSRHTQIIYGWLYPMIDHYKSRCGCLFPQDILHFRMIKPCQTILNQCLLQPRGAVALCRHLTSESPLCDDYRGLVGIIVYHPTY